MWKKSHIYNLFIMLQKKCLEQKLIVFSRCQTYFYIMQPSVCLRVPWPKQFNQHKHIFSGSLNQISPIEVFCSLKSHLALWATLTLVWTLQRFVTISCVNSLSVGSSEWEDAIEKVSCRLQFVFLCLFWIFLDCMALVEWSERCG